MSTIKFMPYVSGIQCSSLGCTNIATRILYRTPPLTLNSPKSVSTEYYCDNCAEQHRRMGDGGFSDNA